MMIVKAELQWNGDELPVRIIPRRQEQLGHDRLERAFGKRSDGETRPVAKPNFLDVGNIGVNLHATEIACDRKESGRFGIWRDHLADHDTV
jgi:hypothetical protein